MNIKLKLAIVEKGWTHQSIAIAASRRLSPEEGLSELDVTKIITDRKVPTFKQAKALARVVGRPVERLFPEITKGQRS